MDRFIDTADTAILLQQREPHSYSSAIFIFKALASDRSVVLLSLAVWQLWMNHFCDLWLAPCDVLNIAILYFFLAQLVTVLPQRGLTVYTADSVLHHRAVISTGISRSSLFFFYSQVVPEVSCVSVFREGIFHAGFVVEIMLLAQLLL